MANGENSIVMGYVYNAEGKPESVGAMMPPQLPGKVSALEGRVDALETSGGTGSVPELSDAVNSTSSTTAASSKAVKIAYDKAAEAQNVADEAIAKAVNYTGATATEPGVAGLVPPAAAGEQENFLRGDGGWGYPTRQSPTHLYVDQERGDDDNSGLTKLSAFATIDGALKSLIDIYSIGSGGVKIHIAHGTYNKIIVPSYLSQGGILTFTNDGDIGDVTISSTGDPVINIDSTSSPVVVKNITFDYTSDTSNVDVISISSGNLSLEKCKIKINKNDSDKTLYIINSRSLSYVNIKGIDIQISGGNNSYVFRSCDHSTIFLYGNIVISGNFHTFVACDRYGVALSVSANFSGDATGKRYEVSRCSLIHTNGQGPDYLPGSEAGTVDRTSHYL